MDGDLLEMLQGPPEQRDAEEGGLGQEERRPPVIDEIVRQHERVDLGVVVARNDEPTAGGKVLPTGPVSSRDADQHGAHGPDHRVVGPRDLLTYGDALHADHLVIHLSTSAKMAR